MCAANTAQSCFQQELQRVVSFLLCWCRKSGTFPQSSASASYSNGHQHCLQLYQQCVQRNTVQSCFQQELQRAVSFLLCIGVGNLGHLLKAVLVLALGGGVNPCFSSLFLPLHFTEI